MAVAKKKVVAKKTKAGAKKVTKKAVTKKVVAKKAVAKKPAVKATKKVVKKAAVKPVAKKTVAKKAVAKKPSAVKKAAVSPMITPDFNAQFASVAELPAAAQKNASEMLNQGNRAFNEWMATGAQEIQKAQDKIFAVSREGAQQLSRSTNSASGSIQGVVDFNRDNVEACVECGNIAVGISQSVGEELVEVTNRTIAQNVELSKDLFNCRTLNDVFDLHSRFVKNNLETLFGESIKLSELLFKSASDVAVPLNDRVNEAGERMKDLAIA